MPNTPPRVGPNQGPEDYQKFIQDYFRSLTDVPK